MKTWDFGCWDAPGSRADITSLGVTLIKIPLGSGFILKDLCRIFFLYEERHSGAATRG